MLRQAVQNSTSSLTTSSPATGLAVCCQAQAGRICELIVLLMNMFHGIGCSSLGTFHWSSGRVGNLRRRP